MKRPALSIAWKFYKPFILPIVRISYSLNTIRLLVGASACILSQEFQTVSEECNEPMSPSRLYPNLPSIATALHRYVEIPCNNLNKQILSSEQQNSSLAECASHLGPPK